MKRFLVKILLFFSIVAVADVSIGFAGDYLQTHAKGGDTRKTNDLVIKDKHDVVILGSSRACHHYDTPYLTDTLVLDVYNAGYDGNGVVLAYGLLSMMLERYKPQLVVFDVEPAFDIEVYSRDNGHKRYISSLKPYYYRAGAKEVIKDVSEEEWYKCHSGMMRYNTTIISKVFDCIGGGKLNKRGYAPMNGIYTGSKKRKRQSVSDIDDFKLKYLEKLLALAKSKNVPLTVIASPKYGMTNSVELQPVKKLCCRYNVPFFDYYAKPEFMEHKEWFQEPMHLNKVGAREFSKVIAGVIKCQIQ